jgi:hypothetical protein
MDERASAAGLMVMMLAVLVMIGGVAAFLMVIA